jgi:hypothetical protein
VKPILNYGCEVWGPQAISAGKKTLARDSADKLHLSYLRQCMGVRVTTPTAIIMNELQQVPQSRDWIQQIYVFGIRFTLAMTMIL